MVDAVFNPAFRRWLEPSCGQGVFLKAIHGRKVAKSRIIGVDLDLERWPSDKFGCVTRGVDFLNWATLRRAGFDCVIGNPPYIAINRLSSELRMRAAEVCDFEGNPVGVRANTWYPFLIESIRLLRDGGNLAFVLPAACEFADYSAVGRSQLTSMFDRVDLIRSRDRLFEDVAEGAAVLVAKNKGGTSRLYRRHEVDNLAGVVDRLNKLHNLTARTCPRSSRRSGRETVTAREVFDVRIGGVTGDSPYFVLTETQRREIGLPKSAVRPILSRSHHIALSVQTKQGWKILKNEGERVWLFCPSRQATKNDAVRRYLNRPENEGGCRKERYKIKRRDPWYLTPLPEQVDAFLTGMSTTGLWMCMNEMPNLNATNTLYVVKFLNEVSRAQRFAWALSLLTSPVQKQIDRVKRVYADGLSKLEPGQIANLDLPVPPSIGSAVSVYRKACKLYLRGERHDAVAIADEAVLSSRSGNGRP